MEWHLGWFGLNLPRRGKQGYRLRPTKPGFWPPINRGRQAGFPRLFLQFHAVMTLGCTSRFGFDRTFGTVSPRPLRYNSSNCVPYHLKFN